MRVTVAMFRKCAKLNHLKIDSCRFDEFQVYSNLRFSCPLHSALSVRNIKLNLRGHVEFYKLLWVYFDVLILVLEFTFRHLFVHDAVFG